MKNIKYLLATALVLSKCLLTPVVAISATNEVSDKSWSWVAKPQFVNAGDFSEGLAAVQVGNKWGFINKAGKLVIEPMFNPGQAQFNGSFSDGLVAVNFTDGTAYGMNSNDPPNARWGFIDKTGAVVINPQFEGNYYTPPNFSEGLAAISVGSIGTAYFVGIGAKFGFIDKTGKMVIPAKFDKAYFFSEGLAVVEIKGKKGFINRNGEIVIQPIYDSAGWFSEGRASVTLEGKSGFIDQTGKVVIDLKYSSTDRFSDGLAEFSYDDKNYGFIDRNGMVKIEPMFFENTLLNSLIMSFSEGLMTVEFGNPGGEHERKGKFGFLDKNGKIVISPKYDFASNFSEGLASVCVNGTCGYIDKKGQVVIPFQFDEAGDFKDGVAKVRIGNNYGYISSH